MLCQFTFENFKSFKQEAFLDLCAEQITDNIESLITDTDGEQFLPVISIYGPNGGGKSTVLDALKYLRNIILKPVVMLKMSEDFSKEEEQILSSSAQDMVKDSYHKFDKVCALEPTKFSVMFRTKGNEYQYELSMLKNSIVEENLYYREIGAENAVMVFERGTESCLIGDDIERVSVDKIKDSMPLLSHIEIMYDIEVISTVVAWFSDVVFLNYDMPYTDKSVLIPKQTAEKELFFRLLKEMDINISDVRVEEDTEGTITGIYTKHFIGQSEIELSIAEESSGTRKIFSCLARIIRCLNEGALLAADELDAKLHPKLFHFIIELFTSPVYNPKGAQLLITSHDIVNMNPDVFRRDEIYFCSLGMDDASTLYSLISFKEENGKPPRKDAVYGKRYLEGKYGADPYIQRGIDWEMEE